MTGPLPSGVKADLARARAARRHAELERARIETRCEQSLIDAEVRQTRTTLLQAAHRLRGRWVGFLDEDFLMVADPPTLHRAILDAAVTLAGAASADLQLYDPRNAVLRMVAHRGFTDPFLSFFADVAVDAPTACAAAALSGHPVLIDDVTRSPIFTGHSTLDVMVGAGSRAVYSYPLHDAAGAGGVAGVLSYHYPKAMPRQERAELVARAAALALVRAPSAPTTQSRVMK